MLDDMVDQPPASQEWGLFQVKNWHLHFCLIPRTCYLTGKMLWFKKCYKGSRQVRHEMTFVEDAYYVQKAEFIFWNLRGKK